MNRSSGNHAWDRRHAIRFNGGFLMEAALESGLPLEAMRERDRDAQ